MTRMMRSTCFAARDDDSVAGVSTADSVATTTAPSDSTARHHDDNLRPILVGYAFGPKKMSTMGIIMAEASKAQLSSSVITAEIPVTIETTARPISSSSSGSNGSATEATLVQEASITTAATDKSSSSHIPLTSAALARAQSPRTHRERVTFSILGGPNGGLRNIVRHFRSSCSSVATSSEDASTTAPIPSSLSSSSTARLRQKHPVRVSFVPLDMDTPLEEQHGGQLDVILHKLTEDILCMSTIESDATLSTDTPSQEDTYSQAMARVQRLNQYQQNHPQCCLIDHPSHVQVVMSRSDIANVLQRSLVGVTSASGLPVRTPRFQVIGKRTNGRSLVESTTVVADAAATNTHLPLPLIAKPLQAAGTKTSHRMGVVLQPSGLSKVDTPCLLQEYANHNATLFKVYVLGSHVSVFERPSLPNLPRDTRELQDYVEFDSQRPYPTLEEFGFESKSDDTTRSTTSTVSTTNLPSVAKRQKLHHHAGRPVTVEEIRPVVQVLAKAFGLELFGFDILVTSDATELLVVDVNYFPSYKEVSNFPSLLANYLTQRAIEGRMKRRAK